MLLIRLDLASRGCPRPAWLARPECSADRLLLHVSERESHDFFNSIESVIKDFLHGRHDHCLPPALTVHLFRSVLVAFPSPKLNNYGATLFSLRDKFTEQFQMVQNSVNCLLICSNNDKSIYIVDFYSHTRLCELKNNIFTKSSKYFLF